MNLPEASVRESRSINFGAIIFLARGYFVSTVGISEEMIRKYVKHQEKEEKAEEESNKNFNLFEK